MVSRLVPRSSTTAITGTIEGLWSPDDESHDLEFPDHPVSRARQHLRRIAKCVRFTEDLDAFPQLLTTVCEQDVIGDVGGDLGQVPRKTR